LPYPLLKKLVSYLVLWDLDWWQSHLGLGAHLRRWHRKQIVKRWMWIFYNQISKDECEFFTIKFGWIISPCF
jgi:predicted double-glycine peptidase